MTQELHGDEQTITDPLSSWRPGAAKDAILDFVDRVAGEDSAEALPPRERVAVFDNDGTLWCEKPMPIQLDFILRRLAEMAQGNPDLRTQQPWLAAFERDYAWLAAVMDEHYAGDDTNVRILAKGVLAAFGNISVEDFEGQADAFLRSAGHPTLDRRYLDCSYAPMLEVLRHLEANGFANYIASGGGRDFMRPISDEVYGVSREHVIGSGTALAYTPDAQGGTITRQLAPDYLDDGPEKPVHIWTRTGRRPVFAAGNSNGDIEMLDFSQRQGSASLRLLILHDDAEREFDYVNGAEGALARAAESGWTVVSIKHDWVKVF
jgi:phosphoglycolate phosphatase-like HAD superfamily hydrolase